jgi:hypothetical protein
MHTPLQSNGIMQVLRDPEEPGAAYERGDEINSGGFGTVYRGEYSPRARVVLDTDLPAHAYTYRLLGN